MRHEKEIIEGQSPFETGKKISYLRYDALEKLLEGMSAGLKEQANGDKKKSRSFLAEMGREVSTKVDLAKEMVGRMWKIAEKHMRTEDKI